MHNIKELKIWNKAMDLVVNVYKSLTGFPADEKYGLISQIKRSAVSIPSNISEGAGRNSDKEFLYFLSVAHGSSYELQTQLLLAQRLELINNDDFEKLLNELTEIQKMNFKFQETIKGKKIVNN